MHTPSPLDSTAILAAATAQVRRFGESKTNMVDIARALGVSHAALYRLYPSKKAVLAAIVEQVILDEEREAVAHLASKAPAATRLEAMLLDMYRRKRTRFIDDREIHDLHQRILTDRPDFIVDYTVRMTKVVEQLIAQAVERGEWRVDDTAKAASVVGDAVTSYLHPFFVTQLVTAGVPVEDRLRDTLKTLFRAFESTLTYHSDG